MTLTLEGAVAAAKARAQERCPACEGAGGDHLCHGDLAAVRDVALAAARMAYEVSPVEAIMEIERLFGSEGGEDVTSAT